mmetsp:Transcript_64620/g.173025  ORF Transcript_64620/g.173025 Transcript_64620/m.173025 type:complete len:206 (+) Transcript_64620:2347-2964(+)
MSLSWDWRLFTVRVHIFLWFRSIPRELEICCWASSIPAWAFRMRFFSLASLDPSRLRSAATTLRFSLLRSRSSLHWTTVISSWVTCPSIIPLITPRAWLSSSSDKLSGPSPLCLRSAASTRGGIWSPTCLSMVSRGTRSIAASKWGRSRCQDHPANARRTAAWASETSVQELDLFTCSDISATGCAAAAAPMRTAANCMIQNWSS